MLDDLVTRPGCYLRTSAQSAVNSSLAFSELSVVSQRKIYDMRFTVFSNILAQAGYRRRVLREP